jgi:hypothetical protein
LEISKHVRAFRQKSAASFALANLAFCARVIAKMLDSGAHAPDGNSILFGALGMLAMHSRLLPRQRAA